MQDKFFTSEAQALYVVRGIQAFLKSRGYKVLQVPIKEAVAEMYRYSGWSAFVGDQSWDREFSPFDDAVDIRERTSRRLRQCDILSSRVGCGLDLARAAVAEVKPTVACADHLKIVAHLERIESWNKIREEERNRKPSIAPEMLERIKAPRKPQTKASVPKNGVFRGVSVTIVKAILKKHIRSEMPSLIELAASAGIDLDVRVALGLHEELLGSGFLSGDALEEDMEIFGSHQPYKDKFAHISDKGKSVFNPGTKFIPRMSSTYDPDIAVDLNAHAPVFELSSAHWFAGTTFLPAYFQSSPHGMVHRSNSESIRYGVTDYHRRDVYDVGILPRGDVERPNRWVGGQLRVPDGVDGRGKMIVATGNTNRELGDHLLIERSFSELSDEWLLKLNATWVTVPSAGVVEDQYGRIFVYNGKAFQSIIAILVGADLWRLSHRRLDLDLPQQRVRVELSITGNPSLELAIRTLVIERNAFVSHIEPELAHGISLGVRGIDNA
ncbi:hypothetical protein HFO56_03180 [Rhizobium laguerreae]|uniref:hypothetical protein n=1 Tax=Rhizobium laguerreae TaxID=1076926 RepID=UPI001C901FBA|nr:hypothetical protein [Rhizobium laguerreae]MBY3151390.1 hypothetical protein [Rhizobium laguerreae]